MKKNSIQRLINLLNSLDNQIGLNSTSENVRRIQFDNVTLARQNTSTPKPFNNLNNNANPSPPFHASTSNSSRDNYNRPDKNSYGTTNSTQLYNNNTPLDTTNRFTIWKQVVKVNVWSDNVKSAILADVISIFDCPRKFLLEEDEETPTPVADIELQVRTQSNNLDLIAYINSASSFSCISKSTDNMHKGGAQKVPLIFVYWRKEVFKI